MLATVYFATLTDDQRRNLISWSSDIGRAYLAARDGHLDDPAALAMFKLAATTEATDSESVWVRLQNMETPWSENPAVTCRTTFPRSMDVGDLILWADGRVERCASVGFEPVHADMVPMLRHHLTTCAVEG